MADASISKTILNNRRFTITTTPKNSATPPAPVTPTLAWSSAPAGKVNLEPSADTLSCVVHPISGQTGIVNVAAAAQDGGNASGNCSVTLQSALAATINMVAGPDEPDV